MNIQEIKQRFYSLRNGIVADAYHKAGAPWGVVFGLQLPQLSAIAKEIGKDETLAKQLWCDINVRESRLLALYLFDAQRIEEEDVIRLASTTLNQEETDMVVFLILSRMPYPETILKKLSLRPDTQSQRAAKALRLRCNP